MFKPNSIILYVDNVDKSTEFYSNILKSQPTEQYCEFSIFELSGNFMLGIQSKSGINPKPQIHFGGFELCMSEVSKQDVDVIYYQWNELGIEIAMKPTTLDFGYTFVALDLDGHRLRVCATDTTNITS